MVRNFTTSAWLCWHSVGAAGLGNDCRFRTEHGAFRRWTYPQSEERYCYLPSWPCEQPIPGVSN